MRLRKRITGIVIDAEHGTVDAGGHLELVLDNGDVIPQRGLFPRDFPDTRDRTLIVDAQAFMERVIARLALAPDDVVEHAVVQFDARAAALAAVRTPAAMEVVP